MLQKGKKFFIAQQEDDSSRQHSLWVTYVNIQLDYKYVILWNNAGHAFNLSYEPYCSLLRVKVQRDGKTGADGATPKSFLIIVDKWTMLITWTYWVFLFRAQHRNNYNNTWEKSIIFLLWHFNIVPYIDIVLISWDGMCNTNGMSSNSPKQTVNHSSR